MKLTVKLDANDIIRVVIKELEARGYRLIEEPKIEVGIDQPDYYGPSTPTAAFRGVTAVVEDSK